ncbi:MAG: putative PEP-binding protein [Spirochaetaceae bacterium]
MKDSIHFFSKNNYVKDTELWDRFGLRGKQANDFASLDLPIVPGFIIDSGIAAHLEDKDLVPVLKSNLKKCEKDSGKVFNDTENPMLVKAVISPNLAIAHYPTLHNFGLTDKTLDGFTSFVGEEFAYHEILFLLRGYFSIEKRIAELEENPKKEKELSRYLDSIQEATERTDKKAKEAYKKLYSSLKDKLPKGFCDDAFTQLEIILKRISTLLSIDEMDDEDAAIIVQPMVYGNYGSDSGSGDFFTRNIVTGEKKLQGTFFPNTFDIQETEGEDIYSLDNKYVKELEKVAETVEDHFFEIRSIHYTIENKKLWLVDQRPLVTKSTQADIQTLLDLHRRKKISTNYLIHAVKPEQLNEILHPVINPDSVKSLKSVSGGIAGAPGAAIGKVYFSTDSLLDAYKTAQQRGEDTRMILCMPSTFAEDVKAIEVAKGVLSAEGGFSAHASVVARQYGKVSLVHKDLVFSDGKAKLGAKVLKEGDLITLQVPHYGDPNIYFGEAELIEPDPDESGLIEFVVKVKKEIHGFNVRVNADSPRDAALARRFGADGIGLCRTEHMFFQEDRINVFRQMIVSESEEKRRNVLAKLKKMQVDDFYGLFTAMDGCEVTIRLLDAPLHEFLPHNEDQMKAFIKYLNEQNGSSGKKVDGTEIRRICDSLGEFNPMLGHRGCRVAVSYPEIYEMQVEALFEAAYKARKKGIKVFPEIMIPLIMNSDELKLVIYGKKIEGKTYKGLAKIEQDVREKQKEKQAIDYKFGTMVELPVAALSAGDIARYAEFFSFGTNDLTQTTIGLSRDDYTSFMPDYTLYDILPGNPFQLLDPSVKELISTAVRRGKMTRPNIATGLCGEHGAIPDNIAFCMQAGLNYVSCSVYSVPIAALAVAQQLVEST